MPRGALPYDGPVVWTVSVEDDKFPIVRLSSDVSSEQRSGHHGPLLDHEDLLTQVAIMANVRLSRTYEDERRAIFQVSSWRVLTRCRKQDADVVAAALRALSEGDPSQCIGFASAPMHTVLSEHRMMSARPLKIR